MTSQSVADYKSGLNADQLDAVEQIEAIVRRLLPDADYVVAYGIPTAKIDGRNVVHWGAFTKHVSVFPVPDVQGALAEQIAKYRTGRGTMSFPLDQKLPTSFIQKVVSALKKADAQRAATKSSSKGRKA